MRELEPDLQTDLTVRQEEVLDFIEDFITRERMPPTRMDLCKRFDMWPNAVQGVLNALVKKKRITIAPHTARGIRLSDEWRLANT